MSFKTGNGARNKRRLLRKVKFQKTQDAAQIQNLRKALEEVEISRDHFARLYDNAPTGYITFDEEGRIRGLNLAAANLAGMPRERMIGLPFTSFIARRDSPKLLDLLRRCRSVPGKNVETEMLFLGRGKVEVPVQVLSVGFRQSGTMFYQVMLIDIRAHKAAEQRLQDAKEYSERIIQTVHQPLLVLDKDLTVILVNSAFYRVFKARPKEVIGAPFHCLRAPGQAAAKLEAQLRDVIQRQRSIESLEFECHTRGRPQFLLLNAQPFFHKTHSRPLLLLSLQDITERHEAEAVREHLVNELGKLTHELEDRVHARTQELRQVNAKLQTLSARLLEAQELERRHLARELHDEVGQQITCLQILTESHMASAPPTLRNALKETRQATKELLQTVRQLSSDLRPQLLDDFGVLVALEWHFKRFRKRTGIVVKLDKKHFRDDLLNSFLRNVLFRATQEALTNVARHAHTNKVSVKLSTRTGMCRLQISDRGSGFNVEQALKKGSFGLAAMQERVFLAGGTLRFDSAPSKGTTVEVELPLVSPHTNAFDPDHAPEPS